MKVTELLSHIADNLKTGKPAAYNLVLAATGEPAESYKLNFDNPELYEVRQYPEIISKTDDIMYSPGVPGQPPVPWGVDYRKLNQLIYERISQKPTTAAYRVFHSEGQLKDFALQLIKDYCVSPVRLHAYAQGIKAGTIKL